MFSTNALPVPGSSRAFAGSNDCGVADLPPIDVPARAPHDYYGHLGHATVAALCPPGGLRRNGPGRGAYLRRWGYGTVQIT